MYDDGDYIDHELVKDDFDVKVLKVRIVRMHGGIDMYCCSLRAHVHIHSHRRERERERERESMRSHRHTHMHTHRHAVTLTRRETERERGRGRDREYAACDMPRATCNM